MTRRPLSRPASLLALTLAPALALAQPAAQPPAPSVDQSGPRPSVKIGVITDMAGPLSAQSGQGSVVAAGLAAEDCLAAECKGMHVDILSADHQNKPDVAVGIVRKWIDVDHVDAVTDIIQAAVQLAVQGVMAEKNRIALFPGGTARLTNEACAPATSVVWMWDTYGQAVGIAKPLAKPGSKWFMLAADYAFGQQLVADATSLVTKAGGEVIGSVRHPFNFSGDFSPFLLQAQASGADVIALGSTGTDLINILKAAREFGIGADERQKLASFVLTVPDIAALGLPTAQGVTVNEAFYWDLDDGTRAFARRFVARHHAAPSTIHAGVYSVVLHYLRAVAAAGTTDTAAVMAKMHALPIEDPIMHHATLRRDGRMVHDSYLFRVKAPAESHGPYDVYTLQSTIPADQAFRPLAESACPSLKPPP